MPAKHFLQPVPLTHSRHLATLVENRRTFNLNNCELNVFESYQKAFHVPLTFHHFVITSMVRGKKVMHLFDKPSFDYLPGETVIVPADETMIIDFPEADAANPTQCIALAIDTDYINHTLHYLNEFYNADDETTTWKLQLNQYHFANDNEITELINKIIRICSDSNAMKNVFADLNLKELLIRLLQSQHLQQVAKDKEDSNNKSRLHFILHYIHEHLSEKIGVDALSRKAYLSRNIFFKWFREQFGITPLEYINKERVNMAKGLLVDAARSIGDISCQCGFSNVNYFIRVFKKREGITPGAYQQALHNRQMVH